MKLLLLVLLVGCSADPGDPPKQAGCETAIGLVTCAEGDINDTHKQSLCGAPATAGEACIATVWVDGGFQNFDGIWR